jgi:ABC-type dipeptide/oligopeptide/nickel transport system ATPase component
MEFKKAVKRRQRLRLAIDGVSGSGKTYTALAIASGIGGRRALFHYPVPLP